MNGPPDGQQPAAAPPAAASAAMTLPPSPAAAPPTDRRGRLSRNAPPLLAVALAIIVLLALTVDWDRIVGRAGRQTTNDAFVQGDLTPIAAKVAGSIRAVPVTDYQPVRAGELIALIVDDDYRVQVEQAAANVEVQRAAIRNFMAQRSLQDAQIAAADANVAATAAQAERYRLDDKRQRALVGGGAASEATLETSTANLK